MPRRTTAAKRYAEAIAGLARDAGTWQRWRDDLERINRAFEEPVLRLSLDNPRVSPERKQSLVRERLGGAITPEAQNLLWLMVRRGRTDLLPDVATWFAEFADRAEGRQHFTVTSAAPLAEEQRAALKARLGGGRGEVILTEQVDPEILGGLVIRHGDVIRDHSVRARLESMRERMN